MKFLALIGFLAILVAIGAGVFFFVDSQRCRHPG